MPGDATFSRSDLRLSSLDLGSSSSGQLWSLRPDTLFFPDKPFPLFSSIPYFLHSAFLFPSLLTEAFTHRCFYTHKLIHTKAFTHTEAFLRHRSFCTQSTFYTENLLHRNCSSKTGSRRQNKKRTHLKHFLKIILKRKSSAPKWRKIADKSSSQPWCSHSNTISDSQLPKTIVFRTQPQQQERLM